MPQIPPFTSKKPLPPRGLQPPALLGVSGLSGAFNDACCAPRPCAPAPLPALALRRTRLADIDANIHCSIVGTCLTTAELRKLMARLVPSLDRKRASDLEIHHMAVELSTEGGLVAKELNKALDTRHTLGIKRFKAAANEDALDALWRAALASGDVPGAYWALMTHPLATMAQRTVAFGDVHMLSHLVGASNRADIRRLVALEAENATLKEQNERQQARLHDISVQHSTVVRQLGQQVAELTAQRARHIVLAPTLLDDEVSGLRHSLAQRERQLALQTTRQRAAQVRLLEQQVAATGQQAETARLRNEAATARAETLAVEQALCRALTPATDDDALQLLDGKTVLYVGGRPGATAVLARLVAAAGGQLLLHDGGIEERNGVLDALLPRAHMVLFPVDCISHNAMHQIKRGCERHGGIAWHPLRSASVASFIELMTRLAAPAPTELIQAIPAQPVSHFCLRHG